MNPLACLQQAAGKPDRRTEPRQTGPVLDALPYLSGVLDPELQDPADQPSETRRARLQAWP